MNQLVAQYHDQGYTIVRGAIDPVLIDTGFKQFDKLMAQAIKNLGVDPASLPGVNEKYLYLKDHHPVMKSHVYDLMKLLDSVRSMANTPPIIDTVKAIAGDPVLVDHVLIRIDDPSNDRRRPLHQEGLGQISYNSVNVWVPLIDVDENTGTMCFHPASHHQGYVKHRFYPELGNYHGICDEFIPHQPPELARLQRGDALFFHPCLLHGSAPMLNPEGLRWTLIARYSDLAHAPYLRDENEPMHIEKHEGEITAGF